ncbi:helix-turn-helix domain-containing protein [Listeria monocytogenes]|uniref:helix-turn-helix domain-containing protein n=1 Tax=Listeria monocytogenes TaxID=1639 RepID=UPI0011EA81A0|nr:helix-turn-helix domain-containing protein [Listeria monocytogenes]EHC5262351.1 helix-turn-helix domain-containing protein [Listeria monocytogenes serotype 1/2a]EAE6286569.1 helix-turn-helix domain-containing protein [Listeria monocytogenes]EID2624592.1 helix-turn-helix domain-containing protein [Listeria monocytogenes]EJQ3350854.1 helix-turn-helix domain-containing protein [Listeria monocytogenes]ELQ0053205.1 helix-turn-helix domain-containing protein [Listeria monocytogenes]
MEIYERIVQLRIKKSISQKELAQKINIDDSTMNKIEKGNRPIRDKELAKIADVLEVSTDYLLGRAKNNIADTIAAHIDSNASEEDIKEILAYIEEKRKEHVNEEEINITEIASKEDDAVDKFVEENEDFKAVAARVMNDAEAVKAVKSFIEFYEQQKNN